MDETQLAFLLWQEELIPDNSAQKIPSIPILKAEYMKIQEKLIANATGPIRRFKPKNEYRRLVLWCTYVDKRDGLDPWTTFECVFQRDLETQGERERIKPYIPGDIFYYLNKKYPAMANITVYQGVTQ